MSRQRYFWAAAGMLYSLGLAVAVRYGICRDTRIARVERERRIADDATSKGMDSAETANRAKSELLANMSHDMRAPANAIVVLSESVFREEMSAEGHRNVRAIRDEGRHLLILINDILGCSKMVSGTYIYEKAPFDLRNLVDEVASMMSMRAHERGLELKHDIQREVPANIIGDAMCVRRILMNLVGNAVKFTELGSVIIRVKIGPAETESGRITISVQDTGIGLSPERLDAILERCGTRASGSVFPIHHDPGHGISIARRMAEGMGGTIRAESEPGRGSNFTLTLVLDAAPETAESAAARFPDRRVGAAFGEKSRPLSILMAEDNENNRLVVQTFVENSSIRIDIAINGAEAVRMFQSTHYDLVLMDIQMPIMDGLTATREIRKWEAGQGSVPVPIVALTSHAMKEDRDKSLAAGCDAHMTKPISKKTLMRAVYQFTTNSADSEERFLIPEDADLLYGPLQVRNELQTIIPRFLENYRKSCLIMRDAFAVRDYKSLRVQAHNIKGSGSSCGFPHISEIGRKIERSIQTGDDAGIQLALDHFEMSLDELESNEPE